MTMMSSTGAELPDLFADARHDECRIPWAFIHAGPFVEGWPPSRTLLGAAAASATVPMHVREGITISGLTAGMVTAGTASGDERWAGALVAARGCLVVLDSGRIADDGVRRSFWPVVERHFEGFAMVAVRAALDAAAPDDVEGRVHVGEAPAPDPGPEAEMEQMARAMVDVPAAVPVARPQVPELTDEPLENVRRLFALTVGQLADLFGVTERQAHRYLREGLPENRRALADALTAVGLTVIGGLGARGARRWLFTGAPTAAELATQGRIAELRERAEALRDSPVT